MPETTASPPLVDVRAKYARLIDWAQSTVRTGEAASGRWGNRGDLHAMVARATGWCCICADINSRACASVPIRLYRPVRENARKMTTRPVKGKARLKYLRSVASGPGVKAAQYAEYAGDIEEVLDHPALDLVRRPSTTYPGTLADQLAYWYRDICGNSFDVLIAEGSKYPTSLVPLQPQFVRVIPDRRRFIKGFMYGRDGSIEIELDAADVLHRKRQQSPFTPYYGIGCVFAVLAEADLDSAANEAEKASWSNGARPDFAIILPEGTTGEQRDQYEAKINANHRGPRNKGRWLVTTQAELFPLSFSMKEMEYLAGKQNIRERILGSFGVPESMVKLNDTNRASAQSGEAQWKRETIQPRVNQNCEELTERILPEFDEEPGAMWFAADNCVPIDEEKQTTRAVSLINCGYYTINEAKAEAGEDAVEDTECDIRRFNGVALDSQALGAEAGTGTVEGQPGAPIPPEPSPTVPSVEERTALKEFIESVSRGDFPAEGADAFMGVAFPWLDETTRGTLVAAAQQAKQEADAKAEAEAQQQADLAREQMEAKNPPIKSVDTNADTTPTQTKAADAPKESDAAKIARAYQRMIDELAPLVASYLAQHPDASPAVALSAAGYDAAFIAAVAGPIEGNFGKGWTGGIADLPEDARGIVGGFDLANPDAIRFLDAYKFRLSESTRGTLAGSLEPVLQEQLTKGASIAEIQAALHARMSEGTPYMAERIARTEASRAFNVGRVSAWKQSGVVVGKEWLLSGNPCPICVELSKRFNEAIGLDEPFIAQGGTFAYPDGDEVKTFTATYESVFAPPIHPNCSCSIGAKFAESKP